MKKILVSITVLLFIIGCSNSSKAIEAISPKDLCITHSISKSNICYGDEKSEIEKVIGQENSNSTVSFSYYDDGVSIIYRDHKVASISLSKDSKGTYQTVIKAKIGDSKDSIKKLFGDSKAVNIGTNNLDYFYDTELNVFLDESNHTRSQTQENMDKVLIISFTFDSDGLAERIMLIDAKMAIYLK